ncbi:MAG: NAD-binding protein [candidate division Zixibacteria bacterium]|nr:NAD-binding protein [candidate division Zixibacteria bacterium]
MKVVILGCSLVGAEVASWFSSEKNQVSVIDSKENSFNRLPKDFKGEKVLGMGIDVPILIQAGIEGADAFLCLSNSDNTNIMAAQLVKQRFKVPKVIIRVYDPQTAKAFGEMGLDIICPTTIVADKFKEFLKSG